MEAEVQDPRFRIGMRVRAKSDHLGLNSAIHIGSEGRIVKYSGGNSALAMLGVEWDDDVHGHDLGFSGDPATTCETGHGWFVDRCYVEPIPNDDPDETLEIDPNFWEMLNM